MHENYTLENCTLQVEDIDSQAAKVWVLILGWARAVFINGFGHK